MRKSGRLYDQGPRGRPMTLNHSPLSCHLLDIFAYFGTIRPRLPTNATHVLVSVLKSQLHQRQHSRTPRYCSSAVTVLGYRSKGARLKGVDYTSTNLLEMDQNKRCVAIVSRRCILSQSSPLNTPCITYCSYVT